MEDQIIALIKFLPHHAQKYGVFVATLGALIYHWVSSRSDKATATVSAIFDYAVHLADSKNNIHGKEKMDFAIGYVKDVFKSFTWHSFAYWKVHNMQDFQIVRAIEISLEAKRVGIQGVLTPIISNNIKRI